MIVFSYVASSNTKEVPEVATALTDVVTTEVQAGSSKSLGSGSAEVATVIVALFEEVGKMKTKKSLPQHVMKNLPSPVNDFEQIFLSIINRMVERGFLKDNPKTYAKTELWSRSAVFAFCSQLE